MKKQFDIKYRPQIESGEYRVETKAGCPVRIVCWDMLCELPILGLVLLNDEKAEEIAVGFTNKGTNLLGEPLYDKLFIVTSEEKLTPLEDCLSTYLKNDFEYFSTKKWDEKKWNETMRIQAAELLSLAREELFANDTVLKEYAEVAREQGKAKALEAYSPTYTTGKRHAKRVQSELVDTHKPVRAIFQQGYEKAEKDLALTLEQVVKLDNIIMNMVGEGYNDGYKTRPFYEEVLKRFNAKRNEKEI